MDFFTAVLWVLVILAGVLVFVVAWWGLTPIEDATNLSAESHPDRVTEHARRGVWVIYNPIKIEDTKMFLSHCSQRAEAAGFHACTFIETTEDDPGIGQAQEAVQQGATRIVVAGGDGTVRLVAGAISHTGIPLGVLPLGTGNLYARNINIPTDDFDTASRIAFQGEARDMDLAWLNLHPSDIHNEDGPTSKQPDTVDQHIEGEHPFLVMAGMGFDADMMADTDSGLKQKIGWGAYVAAGIKNAFGERMHVQVRLDDAPRESDIRLRSILFANCGTLPGGVVLVPDATPNDGLIDVCALDIRHGVLGWVNMAARVIMQGIGIRHHDRKLDASSISFRQAQRASLRAAKPYQVQIDGDPAGMSQNISVRVDPLALRVALPESMLARMNKRTNATN